MSTDVQLRTAEQYAEMTVDGRLTELVRGEIVELNQPAPRHGQICSRVNRIIGNFVEEQRPGHVVSNNTGIATERDPDTVHGGDVWFISCDNVPPGPLPSGYLTVPPDLVIEVLSPSNSRAGMMQKVAEYRAADITVVAVLDPEEQTVPQYYADKSDVILQAGDTLSIPEELPGFAAEVNRFFQ